MTCAEGELLCYLLVLGINCSLVVVIAIPNPKKENRRPIV